MRFAVNAFEGKELYLVQTLLAHGHTRAERIDETDLLLLDCDAPWAPPRPAMIAAAAEHGAHVALYPHGGMPTCWMYDGIAEPDPLVEVRLEHGPGSIGLAALIGVELYQYAPGWLYSPTQPFTPVKQPRKVLFAPLHPIIEGLSQPLNGHDPAPAINQQVYKALLALGYVLTVSVVGPPQRSGIWPHPRARIIPNPQMTFTQSYEQVMAADVVVAASTCAALAVACGKPTVMLGQDNWQDYVGGKYPQAAHPELYADAIRYPLDVGMGELDELIRRACAGDAGAAYWREQFIGDDGAEAAVTLLEEISHAPLPNRANLGQQNVVIEGVTATMAGGGN